MPNLHEIEERDFGRDGPLWDADPDVCCAAFQLGACPHTEAFNEEYDLPGWDEGEPESLSGCVVCDGPLMLLGQLGSRTHLRCRNCGLDQSVVS